EFNTACCCYFSVKDIPADERIGKIIYNFESTTIQSWINAEEARLLALAFPDFLIALKKKFLPHSWEDELVQAQILPQGTTDLLTWVNSVQNANDELGAAKTPYHIPDDHFQLHLIPCLTDRMKRLYKANGTAPGATKGMLNAITDFEEWMEHLQLLEQDLQVSHAGWVTCTMKAGNVLHDSSAQNINITATTPTPTPNIAYTTPLKLLTDEEKTLLRQHLGCYKCHIFYAGHLGQNCTNPRPMLDDCKRVTAANAAKAKAAYNKIQAASHAATTTVATIFEADAVFKDSKSNGDSEDYVDANEIEEYVPLSFALPQHLHWTCCIDAPDTCAPTPVNALIDHGSSPVLISSELADILCLTARPLFKPLSVSGAFSNKSNKRMPLILIQYCRLSIISLDSLWHSRIINTIICPELHTDLILSLDFLVKNKIVVDTELQTVIAKESGYDLLNPPNPKLHCQSIIRSPSQHRKLEAQQIKAGQKDTKKTRMKDSFADHFPSDIPHVKDLPRDVYHHINLLPGAPVSITRAYGCPQKYRVGWKMLIDQHVAAGRIHPSSSPYASPSFIIPKADPMVLP
ncbi:hypothetical protein L208DRAFT_1302210, partial [Tricholoma matsutake]